MDQIRNEIRKELEHEPVNEQIKYKTKWSEHVKRMNSGRLQNQHGNVGHIIEEIW